MVKRIKVDPYPHKLGNERLAKTERKKSATLLRPLRAYTMEGIGEVFA